MISRDYIHSMDEISDIERTYSNTMAFIENCFMDAKIFNIKKSDLEFFDEYTSESAEYIREGVTAAIKKIGDKIIEIVKRCKKFIKDKLSDLKNLKWRMSSDEKKIDTAIAKNPALADDIKIAIADGNIKISDIKDIKTFYDEVENIMNDMKKDQINPKSLKGRFEKAKKKLANAEKPIKAVLTLSASALGLYLTYRQIKKLKSESDNHIEDVAKNSDSILDKITTERNALENIMERDPSNKTASKMALLAEMTTETERISGKNISLVTQFKTNVIKKMDKLVQKLPMVKRDENAAYNEIIGKLDTRETDVGLKKELHRLEKLKEQIQSDISRFTGSKETGSERLDVTKTVLKKDKKGKSYISREKIGDATSKEYRLDMVGLGNLYRELDKTNADIVDVRKQLTNFYRNNKK